MNSRSIYNKSTGRFTGAVICVPDDDVAGNLGPDEGALDGIFDHLSQQVDLDTKEVADFQPAPPSDDHEWIHDDEHGNRVRRWVLNAAAINRQARRENARSRIAQLEGKLPRALLEAALGVEPTDADRAAGAMTLQQIQNELATLRPEVR